MAGHPGMEIQVTSIQVQLYTPATGINVQACSLLLHLTSFTVKLIFMVLSPGSKCESNSFLGTRDERLFGVIHMPSLEPGKRWSSVDSWCFAPVQESASLFPSDGGCHCLSLE